MPRTPWSGTSHTSNYIVLNRQIFQKFLTLWQDMNTLLINAVTDNPNISSRSSGSSTGTTRRRYRSRAGRTVGKVTTMRKAA